MWFPILAPERNGKEGYQSVVARTVSYLTYAAIPAAWMGHPVSFLSRCSGVSGSHSCAG